MMTLSPAIPILRIFSVDKAKEFYLDFLGFTLAWEHRFSEDLPLYMQVTRTGLTLHLSDTTATARPAPPFSSRCTISTRCTGSSRPKTIAMPGRAWRLSTGAKS